MSDNADLKKSLTWKHGAAMTVGGVIGSGILVLPAVAAVMAGPASIVSWILMAFVSIPTVTAVGAMSSQFPDSGGIASYAERAFSARAGNLVSVLILTAMPIGMPLTALIGANYLADLLGLGMTGAHAAAGSLLIIAAVLNYRGVEMSGKAQVFVVSVIISILLFVVLSAVPQVRSAEFVPFCPHGIASVLNALPLLFFAFLGWEMIGHVSEEFKNPKRDVPISLGAAFIIVCVIYLAAAVVIIGSGVYKSGNPNVSMITLVSSRWGSAAAAVVAVLGFVACYCPLHTYTAGFSRLIYAQARSGTFPVVFAHLHPVYKTPHVALLCYTPVFLIILALSCLFSWDLRPLISMPSTSFLLVYTIGMFSAGRCLKDKTGKLFGYTGALLSAMVFVCSGWYMLYPLTVVSIFVIWCFASGKQQSVGQE